jgi:hypothetical protein
MLLRIAFTVAPIVFGLDKFFSVLVNWEQYLAPWVNRLMPAPRATSCTWAAWWRSRPASSWR